MTDAQKDAIVKAAQLIAKNVVVNIDAKDGKLTAEVVGLSDLLAAVRAAEQRWTVKHTYPAGKPILCHDGIEQRPDRLDEEALSNIARLLNEDDAKGGK